LRVYTDVDLLRRFRWTLLLGPVVPFGLAMCVVAIAIRRGSGPEYLLFLMVILTVWDPWHFLMQHYGFMRIYDRPNRSPRWLAARMDLMISATWYVYMLVAAASWLPELLYRFYAEHGLSLLLLFDSGVYPVVEFTLLVVALACTVVYAAYLGWCVLNGYYVSVPKIVLLVLTFGVVYVAYVPNQLIEQLAPGWTFAVGFATVNMVHVSQYMVIVWKYNRSLAGQGERFRNPWLRHAFLRGGLVVAVLYLVLSVAYGLVISEAGQRQMARIVATALDSAGMQQSAMRWYAGVFFALGFTSTLLHYYYDGFIWKVRHQENRQNLAMDETDRTQLATSWWDRQRRSSAGLTLLRQGLYFGAPMLFLWVTFVSAHENPDSQALQQLRAAIDLHNAGSVDGLPLAQQGAASARRQIDVEERMLEIRPAARHFTYIGHLHYWRARAAREVLASVDTALATRVHRAEIHQAIRSLEQALDHPGPYSHPATGRCSRADVESLLAECRREARSVVGDHHASSASAKS